ncbi:MAG: hypothetical protein GQE15_11050 [Archangiaceae bacterium]|nr:hypothetical protein [Archangiaceae bacterium]
MSNAPNETKQTLLDAARAERQSETAAKRGLDALLAGAVEPIDVEGPPAVPEKNRLAWVLGALLLALLAFAWWSKLTRVETPAPVPPVVAPIVVTPPPAPVVVVELDAGAVELDAGVPEVDAGQATAPAPAPTKKPVVTDDDALARELALLDEARLQVAKAPRAALATLERHRAQFPRGALKLEADLLRVEAQLNLGRKAEASRLAEALKKADTEGLVHDRLERLFEQHP